MAPSWSKLFVIRALLRHAEWVVHLDHDVLVMRAGVPGAAPVLGALQAAERAGRDLVLPVFAAPLLPETALPAMSQYGDAAGGASGLSWRAFTEAHEALSAALEAAKTAFGEQQTAETAARQALSDADAAQRENLAYKTSSEQYAQNVRCGGNPNKDEELAEKAALAQLKKAIDLHNQSIKVAAARQKSLMAESASLMEAEQTLTVCQAEVDRRAAFEKHATPFFEWLAASDEESEEEEEKPKGKGKAVEVS